MLIVLLDANVLYAAPLRDTLMHLAVTPLLEARWTKDIQAEWLRNLHKNRPDIPIEKLERTQKLMNQALPNALVAGYEDLIPTLLLPDPDDRHVLAAAIVGQAKMIVTANLQDFPDNVLAPYGIKAIHPDDLVDLLFSQEPVRVLQALKMQRSAMKNPPMNPLEFIELLERQGLKKTAKSLAAFAILL
jgi:predicted nucleic acid-binding protein